MRLLRTSALLLALLLTAAACARDLLPPFDPDDAADVGGRWVLVYPHPEGARYEKRMSFGTDGVYQSEGLWIGFYGQPADEVTGSLRIRGRYRLDGDVLMLRITRSEMWQKYGIGANPSIVSRSDAPWEERGTMRVEGGKLIHTYVSAPADAPTTYTEVYEREP